MAVPTELNPLQEAAESSSNRGSDNDDESSIPPDRSSRKSPMQFFTDNTSLDEEISRFDGDGEDFQQNMETQRMSSPSSLSFEALTLLRNASRSVMKKKKRVQRGSHTGRMMRRVGRTGARSLHQVPNISPAAKISTGDATTLAPKVNSSQADSTRGGDSAHLLLLQELHYLRSLLPSNHVTSFHGDLDSEPCVVKDALGYLKCLKEELRGIKEGMKKNLKPKANSEAEANLVDGPKLEVNLTGGPKLEVKVSCQKRPGILGDVMVVLESHGLVFDKVDASCHHRLLFQAVSSQDGVHLLDKQALKKALWVVISRR